MPDYKQIVEDCADYLRKRVELDYERHEYAWRSSFDSVPYGSTFAIMESSEEHEDGMQLALESEAEEAWFDARISYVNGKYIETT